MRPSGQKYIPHDNAPCIRKGIILSKISSKISNKIIGKNTNKFPLKSEEAVSNANFRAFEAALFLCIEAKIQKIKKKASK